MRKYCCIVIAGVCIACAASPTRATVQVLDEYRLGEDDPGAMASSIGQTLTHDHTANQLDLTRLGQPHYSADVGAAGSSLSMSFDPATVDAYYRTPFSNLSDNFGIEAWVKTAATSDGVPEGVIVYNGIPDIDGFGLLRVEGQTPFGGLTPAYVGKIGSTSVGFTAVPDQQWTSLALVRNGGTSTFYVDGVPVGSSAAVPVPAAQAFSVGAAYCATCARISGTSDYLKGGVDEVRIFTFAPGQFDPKADLNAAQPAPEPIVWCVLAAAGLLVRPRRTRSARRD